jgi:polysaccharide export outer membrane protein
MRYSWIRGQGVPMIVRIALLGVVTFGCLLLRGQDLASVQNSSSAGLELRRTSESTPRASIQDYVISPDDQLDIYVLDVPEVSRVYRVTSDGTITLPLLSDPIVVIGLTPTQLSNEISERLRTSGMVANARVTVQVKESRVQSIAVTGAVRKPQVYSLFGKTTLLDALSQTEGLAEDAGNIAVVTRGQTALRMLGSDEIIQAKPGDLAGRPRTVRVDLKQLFEDGDASQNLDLYPGDRVTVQRAGVVYVVGAVNRAGGFVLKNDREQMTVLKAIALAESLKSTATPGRALILRKSTGTPATADEIPVNLTKILTGHRPDFPLLAGDILFVPDSSTKKALHRAGEAAAQAAALVAYRVP